MPAQQRPLVRRILKWSFMWAIFAVAAMQFVPVKRENPPVTDEPKWDSPQTRAMAQRACYDCHSNETRWPWYASVAPVSWRVIEHVKDGRRKLNFSTGNLKEAHEAAKEVRTGKMPLWDYLLLHPEAKLSQAERQAFINGLQATFGREEGRGRSETEERDANDARQ